ncbi:MAG: RnfABCDGE type electron transport complex subunit B [Fusobacteria bacterium]|nr:RnfABCDGE type electron transport complex subunit B [Fusobacteriota bacterium]
MISVSAILALGGMGLFLGLFLAIAAKKFEVKLDPKVEKLIETLPGVNCGACGYAGCNAYADAISKGEAAVNLCAPGGAETIKNISNIMGINEVTNVVKKVARVMCQGTNQHTNRKYKFDVELKTCAGSMLYFIGDKECDYGCMGHGDCKVVCPFDAIEITDKGIARIIEEKCTACGKCIKACPKSIIKLVPEKSKITVLCSSKDKGAEAKKICSIACIGCGICAKACPVSAIEVKNNLAIIDPKKCINCGICALKCPTNAIYDDIKEKKKAYIHDDKCKACTICKKACPFDAIEGEVKKKHIVIEEKCVGCGVCEEKCPFDAITMELKYDKK